MVMDAFSEADLRTRFSFMGFRAIGFRVGGAIFGSVSSRIRRRGLEAWQLACLSSFCATATLVYVSVLRGFRSILAGAWRIFCGRSLLARRGRSLRVGGVWLKSGCPDVLSWQVLFWDLWDMVEKFSVYMWAQWLMI